MSRLNDIISNDSSDSSSLLSNTDESYVPLLAGEHRASDNLLGASSDLLQDDSQFSDERNSTDFVFSDLRYSEKRALNDLTDIEREKISKQILNKVGLAGAYGYQLEQTLDDNQPDDFESKLGNEVFAAPVRATAKGMQNALSGNQAAVGANKELRKVVTKEAKKVAAKQTVSKAQALRILENTAASRQRLLARLQVATRKLFTSIPHAAKTAFGGFLLPVLVVLIALGLVASVVGMNMMNNHNLEGLSASERQVAEFYFGKGMSNVSVAALMANIRAESGGNVGDEFNASAIQDGHTCLAPDSYANCRPGVGGAAHGLFQLEADGRFQALNNLAIEMGVKWTDINAQCEYIYREMPATFDAHSNKLVYYSEIYGPKYDGIAGVGYYMSFEDWKALSDVDWATESFCRIVERAGIPHMDKRKAYANQYLAIFNATTVNANDTVSRAYAELGKPYVWGAVGPESYDCSGLVSYCLTGQHVRLGNTDTFMGWPRVDNPQPGDICIRDGHTGIFIGNGQMIHAPKPGDVVKIGPVQSGMWYVRYPG